jgi:hypothetical protein
MDTKDAGRKGGTSRTEKKRAASSRNLAKARATTDAALAAFKAAGKLPEERPTDFTPVLIIEADGK